MALKIEPNFDRFRTAVLGRGEPDYVPFVDVNVYQGHKARLLGRSVRTLADEIEYQPLRWQGRMRLATAHEQAGRGAKAARCLSEATAVIQAIAAGLSERELRERFLAAETVQAILHS